jgi:predicted transcriptional regulator
VFEGTIELAENKLLLLYIFNKLKNPVSNSYVTEIILGSNLLNYFHLQQYLGELVDSGLLEYSKHEKRQMYSLSKKGKSVLDYFENRISSSKKTIVDDFLANRKELDDKCTDITASYLPEENGGYTVACRLSENGLCLIELKLNASTKEYAEQLCSNWKKKAPYLYDRIVNSIID